ncbi:MAG: hypothetical protein ACI8RZ_005662 [Myxococcota bacterium]|jgi:hypothetical protein
MPFDKISPSMLRIMRLVTSAMLIALGGAMVYLGGVGALGADAALMAWALPVSAFVYGIFLANAGLMLLELTTRPPLKLSINVPFVAANFQTALCFGLVSLAPAIEGAWSVLSILCVVGVVLNLSFVVMTKMHWNFTENTGKSLPKG